MIQELKYAEHPKHLAKISELFLRELNANHIALPEAIIAVPMHPKRLRAKGFNHSLELARIIASRLDIPLLNNHIKKDRNTPRQATMSLKKRQINLRGSFTVIQKINYRHLAIIDDVLTTGSTAEEISKILKKNGVNYIQVWGVAKTK